MALENPDIQQMPLRRLTASALASLIAVCVPPDQATVYFKDGYLYVGSPAPKSPPLVSFCLTRLAQLVDEYVRMPGAPWEP